LLAGARTLKLPRMAPPPFPPGRSGPQASKRPVGHRVTPTEAGSYLGCPSCGRFLKIEWAVRSVVCSCGAKLPVTPPEGSGS
jgi:hypothetical protein